MSLASINRVWGLLVWRGHSCPRNVYAKAALAGNYSRLLALVAALMIAPYAAAQRSASGAHASGSHAAAPSHTASHSNTLTGRFPRARNGYPFASRRSSPLASPLTSLPFPFFPDSFNPDDIYSSGYPVASDPPPFLLQAMQQLAGSGPGLMGQGLMGQGFTGQGSMGQSPLATLGAPANHQPSTSDPLMIELQNGQYVRVNRAAVDGEALPLKLAPEHPQTSAARPPMITAPSSQPLPAAVLIFRDGHTEEVRDYTIADGTLYARGDYYTDGYWNKKIALAGLNVAETLQANATRNVNFVLPSSPNEVITRP